MALIRCSECGAEISDKAARCPKCGAPTVSGQASNGTAYVDNGSQQEVKQTVTTSPKSENSSVTTIRAIIAILAIIGTLYSFCVIYVPKSYYVVQVSGGISNNGIGYIDSYIHSDKNCCQSLVDMWNKESIYPAKIIKVKLTDTAYKNSLGQSVPYEAVLYYCPYCFKY